MNVGELKQALVGLPDDLGVAYPQETRSGMTEIQHICYVSIAEIRELFMTPRLVILGRKRDNIEILLIFRAGDYMLGLDKREAGLHGPLLPLVTTTAQQ